MSGGYGQFCPVAKAMEILDERWTLLVVRELLLGSRHFNQLRRGVPRMSPALLSTRLKSLERQGILTRSGSGNRTTYELTTAGQDLFDVVQAMGAWGLRWLPELGDEDLDPHLLMWDLRRTVPVDRWPRRRTVVGFVLDDVSTRGRRWWVVVDRDDVDACDVDPGYPVTATVTTTLQTLTRLWRRDVTWDDALRGGTVVIDAPAVVARQVPQWIGYSLLGSVPRPEPVAHVVGAR